MSGALTTGAALNRPLADCAGQHKSGLVVMADSSDACFARTARQRGVLHLITL